MLSAYKWHPITDLEEDPSSLTDGELISLARVWADQKEELVAEGTLDEFQERLRREWSIETGIIENVHTLDRGVTRTLIEKRIDAALIPYGATDREPVVVARIIQDHYEALDGMFDFVGGQRELSTGYIKELHAALLRNQETYAAVDQFGNLFEKRLEKGQYKTEPNSPTRPDGTLHEYCPPEHVAAETDRLIEIHQQHVTGEVPPEVSAAWLHHRFAQIYPFADGNGRVARAISSLVLIKANWFPLIVKREDWPRYIDTDREDLRLVEIFIEAQRRALIQASEIAYELRSPASEEEAIAAVRDRLVQRGKVPFRDWLAAVKTANKLVDVAKHHLNQTSVRMHNELVLPGTGFHFSFGADRDPHPEVLERAGLTADLRTYNSGVQLRLNVGRHDALNFFFYGIGPRFRGLIGVIAYLYSDGSGPILLEGGSFQINYQEETTAAESRFRPWPRTHGHPRTERMAKDSLEYREIMRGQ